MIIVNTLRYKMFCTSEMINVKKKRDVQIG